MPPRRARFRRADRLRDGRDYRRLAASGRRAASERFVVLTTHRGTSGSARLGITASRRVGGAVQRNRVKRIVREWFRTARVELPQGLDIVVIARSAAVALAPSEASADLDRLVRKAAA